METSSFCRSSFTKLSSREVTTNATQGINYRPHFFDLEEFKLLQVDINSSYYQEVDAEAELIKGEFSFCYLREDKLRTIQAYDDNGCMIGFDEFLNRLNISIASNNLFKTSKYLSRVFRPIRYGAFYKDLDIHINENHPGKQTDGISLISVDLARSLGWTGAEDGMSAQFTLLYEAGLVKGHILVSSRIKHDIVIYGNQNIKQELKLGAGLQYVALEPMKLLKNLRLDIQSLINLWPLFGEDQYLMWAHKGIEEYKSDLFSGKLSKWLDNFDKIEPSDYDKESWTLRKAIWHGIDYTRYPGLVRLAWTMFRTSIKTYANNSSGEPVFRIPVPGGMRGYLRVDLRNHNEDGNFVSEIESGTVVLDKNGNLWVSALDIDSFTSRTGGADSDDAYACINIKNDSVVLFRNPNAYNEYVISKIVYDGITPEYFSELRGETIESPSKPKVHKPVEEVKITNNIFEKFLSEIKEEIPYFVSYSRANLLRTLVKIKTNQTNIGTVCNAEMIRSSEGIVNRGLQKKLMRLYNWSLEVVIDNSIKEGHGCDKELESVDAMYAYLEDNRIKVPASLLHRIPEGRRKNIVVSEQHQLDQLLQALNLLIEKANQDVLGTGSQNKGNRKPGLIDLCDIPVIELGMTAVTNPLNDIALSLLKGYNRQTAILLETIKNSPDKDTLRKQGIEKIQYSLLEALSSYTQDERILIVNTWAFQIYKSAGFAHDSILFIKDQEGLRGTADDMIRMLANTGEAYQIKKNGTIERYYQVKEATTTMKSIRVWHQESLNPADFIDVKEIIVDSNTVLLGNSLLNLGDEVKLASGAYQIKQIASSVSRKDSRRILKNSLTIYLSA